MALHRYPSRKSESLSLMNAHLKYVGAISVWGLLGVSLVFLGSYYYGDVKLYVKAKLVQSLVSVDKMPAAGSFEMAYIMGGSWPEQRYKFRAAAEAYRNDLCKRVVFMRIAGLNRYSRKLGRNYTNDELTTVTLEEAGVAKTDVTPIQIQNGPFGTMNEARSVVEFARKHHYRNILIISAPYHSRRVRLSFDHFSGKDGPNFKILGSGEIVGTRMLIYEWLKLQLYRLVLAFS